MSSAFQGNAFQGNAFQIGAVVTVAAAAVFGQAFVRPQVPDVGRSFLQSGVPAAVRMQGTSAIRRQEQPSHLQSFVRMQPLPNSIPPVTKIILIEQEEISGRYGIGCLQAGVQGPNVRPPGDTLIRGQEQPPYYDPFILGSPPTALVEAFTAEKIALTRQEEPLERSGYRWLQPGIQGPDVRGPGDTIITKQEQPPYYDPFVFNHFTIPELGIVTPVVRYAITKQEELVGRVGYRWLQAGVQGPNVKWPGDTVVTEQEQPDVKPSFLLSGQVLVANLKTTAKDFIFIQQQQPDHPVGEVFPGVTAQTVAVPVKNSFFITAENPWHPRSFYWRGLYGPGAKIPIKDFVFQRQEQPRHPVGFTEGRIRIGVAPPVRRTVFQYQEARPIYHHPRPFVRWFQQPAFIPSTSFGRTVITRQEYPRHPIHFTRGVDKPNNSWPPFPTARLPLQRNLTKDMLGVYRFTIFAADPNDTNQVLTSINYPWNELYVLGWTPIGGVKWPIGNLYNRDPVPDPVSVSTWNQNPALVGGWKTSSQNQTDDEISLNSQTGFFVAPTEYQVNPALAQYYQIGLTPIGINVSSRALLGVISYG